MARVGFWEKGEEKKEKGKENSINFLYSRTSVTLHFIFIFEKSNPSVSNTTHSSRLGFKSCFCPDEMHRSHNLYGNV